MVHSRFIEGGWGLMQDFRKPARRRGDQVRALPGRRARGGVRVGAVTTAACASLTRARRRARAWVRVWEDASDAAVNFVQWSPSDQNMLLSAGFDPRHLAVGPPRDVQRAACHRLQGHHRVPGAGKVKGMHRAAFLAQGRYVITTGEKTDLISIYDVATGRAVSRGESDEGGTAVAVLEDQASCVLAVSGARSAIQLYSPLPA